MPDTCKKDLEMLEIIINRLLNYTNFSNELEQFLIEQGYLDKEKP